MLKVLFHVFDSEDQTLTFCHFGIKLLLQAFELNNCLFFKSLCFLEFIAHISDLSFKVIFGEEQALLVLKKLLYFLFTDHFITLKLRNLAQVLIEEFNCVYEELASSLELGEVAKHILADIDSNGGCQMDAFFKLLCKVEDIIFDHHLKKNLCINYYIESIKERIKSLSRIKIMRFRIS